MKIFGLLVYVFILASCSAESEKNKLTILEKVKLDGIIRIGTGKKVPPMNYVDQNGHWKGFDIDLGEKMAEKVAVALGRKLTLERVNVNNRTRVSFLESGRVHLTISSMSYTMSREKAIDFVTPPYLCTQKIFLAKRGKFKNIEELAYARIAVVQGSNAMTAAKNYIYEKTGKTPSVIAYQSNAECMLALSQEKVDVFSQDLPITIGISAKAPGNYEIIGEGYSPGLYSIGVRENESEWRDLLGLAFQNLLKSGEYEMLYKKWFGKTGSVPLPIDCRPKNQFNEYIIFPE